MSRTYKNNSSLNFIFTKEHNHHRKNTFINSQNILHKIKERSISTTESARNIVSHIINTEKLLYENTTTQKYLKEQVQKTRREHFT